MKKEQIQQLIEEGMAEGLKTLETPLNTQEESALKKIMEAVFIDNKPAYVAMGIDKEELEMMYQNAYNLFNSGNFASAENIFAVLSYLNNDEWKFAMGRASCFHNMGEYDQAIPLYYQAAKNDPNDPHALYHLSECFEKINIPILALMSLNQAIMRIDQSNEPKHAALKEQMLLHRNVLCQEFGIDTEELHKIEKTINQADTS